MSIFTNPWFKEVLRSPEDEGAGGASSQDGEGGSPAPDIGEVASRVDGFGQRIQGMEKLLNDFVNGQRQQVQRSELQQFERTLNDRLAEAKTAVTKAETALAEAVDGGEGIEIARAQRTLNEALLAQDRANQHVENYKARVKEQEQRAGGHRQESMTEQTPQNNLDTTNLNAWKSKHRSWYGVDTEMTKAAHEVSDRIRAAGAIPVGSQEYFATIDREMKNKFPDRLGGAPTTAAGGGQGRGEGQRKGRIAQSIVDGWRRMGINTDDPKTVERMMGHRDKLVQKGILTQEPVTDRIVTR